MKHLFELIDRTTHQVNEINREAEREERRLYRIAWVVGVLAAGTIAGIILLY